MRTRIIHPLIFFSFSILFFSCTKHVSFDSQKWKECGQSFDCILGDTRLEMTRDLFENQILLHKSKMEIDSILGKTRMTYFTTQNIRNYKIKEEYSFLSIDPCIIYLEIIFDDNNLSKSIELKKRQT